jgi:hypothetical protein
MHLVFTQAASLVGLQRLRETESIVLREQKPKMQNQNYPYPIGKTYMILKFIYQIYGNG